MDIVWHIPVGRQVYKLFEIAAVMMQKRCEMRKVPIHDLSYYLVRRTDKIRQLLAYSNDHSSKATR